MQMFEAVSNDVPAISHHRAPLLALNKARVSYKHYGNVLDTTQRKTWHPGKGLFDTRPGQPPLGHSSFDDRRRNYVEGWLNNVDDRLRLLMLGSTSDGTYTWTPTPRA